MLKKRASGILLHITSIPARYGIGDLGPTAYRFVKFLKDAGQRYWQILPLNYTTSKTGYSPYNCFSAFAGNPLLISPELLYRAGLLRRYEITDVPAFVPDGVDYRKVSSYKEKLLEAAFTRFDRRAKPSNYKAFVGESRSWLEDFVTFVALRRYLACPWCEWPSEIRDRKKSALRSVSQQLGRDIERERFLQYVFYTQYSDLKSHCEKQGIKIIGDIPVYVAYDSADVWSHPKVFKLDKAKKPRYVAGVPPDYFSRTGQLWGNPVYNWQYLQRTNFAWWMERIKHNLRLFDFVRIDHFRGFVAYWQVPAGRKTAMRGRWVGVPTEKFFATLFKQIPSAPIIAEDLGYITADVREIITKFGFPCMKVLQFGFDGDLASNSHCPHNHIENCIVYTGTHDNNTTRGWFENEVGPNKRKKICEYLGHKISAESVHWEMIRLAMASVARIAIIPMQDVLGLPAKARMNHPARVRRNWLWRARQSQITPALAAKLKKMVETYGRG